MLIHTKYLLSPYMSLKFMTQVSPAMQCCCINLYSSLSCEEQEDNMIMNEMIYLFIFTIVILFIYFLYT